MQTVPFCRVNCDGNELCYIQEVLESGWLTTATKAMTLEKLFSKQVGAKYACAVNSATAALHLACEAVGVRAGDKVFVPTMTFTASAEVIRYMGADPVLLDVEYGTCLVTPAILEQAIQKHPDVKGLVLVHFGGQAAEMGGGEREKSEVGCPGSEIRDPRSEIRDPRSEIRDPRFEAGCRTSDIGHRISDSRYRQAWDSGHLPPTRHQTD